MNYLTIHEIENTLTEAQKVSVRDHLILLLSFRHGMRRDEVAHLTVADVSNGQIHIKRLKGSLETTQPLMNHKNPLFDEIYNLNNWLAIRPNRGQYLFPSNENKPLSGRWLGEIAKHYLLLAGVNPKLAHHHIFRHSFCSIQARRGVKIEYIAQSVGHKDIKNTRIYLNITDTEAMQEAAKALED